MNKHTEHLILFALRNLLEQNNPNGVNTYLISKIDEVRRDE